MSTLSKAISQPLGHDIFALEVTMTDGSVRNIVYSTEKGMKMGLRSIEQDIARWGNRGFGWAAASVTANVCRTPTWTRL
jgi:hypothetical protein